jgi:hypothetical protein
MKRPLLASLTVACITAGTLWVSGTISPTSDASVVSHVTRRLPDAATYDLSSLDSAEAGFVAAIVFFVIIACLLCCCMCSGGRCNLWDLVALVCLWELCCDRDGGIGNYDNMC